MFPNRNSPDVLTDGGLSELFADAGVMIRVVDAGA